MALHLCALSPYCDNSPMPVFAINKIIIHSTHYLFSDRPKACSESSKSVPEMSSSRRLFNNHVNDTQGHRQSHDHSVWFLRVCNHVKFKHFLLHADLYISVLHTVLNQFYFVRCIIKQLLDAVFGISRIIKVSVRVISLPPPWLFWISKKPHLIIVYKNHVYRARNPLPNITRT